MYRCFGLNDVTILHLYGVLCKRWGVPVNARGGAGAALYLLRGEGKGSATVSPPPGQATMELLEKFRV